MSQSLDLLVLGNAIVGGMETYVERLVQHLPPDRFAVTALCPFESPFTERLRARDVEVLVTPMPDDPTWSSIQMTCAMIKAGAIDLLHALQRIETGAGRTCGGCIGSLRDLVCQHCSVMAEEKLGVTRAAR